MLSPDKKDADDGEVAECRIVAGRVGRRIDVTLDRALGVERHEIVELESDARARQPFRQIDHAHDRKVECPGPRKPCAVSLADELPVVVDWRVWETAPDVEKRCDDEAPGRVEQSPGEEVVRDIER